MGVRGDPYSSAVGQLGAVGIRPTNPLRALGMLNSIGRDIDLSLKARYGHSK